MSATFEEAILPLLDAHAALDADVKEKEAELAELKEKRNRLERAVRAVAPERVPSAKAKTNGSTKPKQVSEGSLGYVRDFLMAHVQGEFGTTAVIEHPDYDGVGATTLPHILRKLHERGVIRLVRRGKGQARYYEVIR
jgi:hypothetical protein